MFDLRKLQLFLLVFTTVNLVLSSTKDICGLELTYPKDFDVENKILQINGTLYSLSDLASKFNGQEIQNQSGKTLTISDLLFEKARIDFIKEENFNKEITIKSKLCELEKIVPIKKRQVISAKQVAVTTPQNNETSNGGAIAGGVIGGILGLILLLVIGYLIYKYAGNICVHEEYRPQENFGTQQNSDIFKDLFRIPPKERLL